jgi:hypothetical protein
LASGFSRGILLEMRYRVANLGQVECTGDVCRVPPRKPAPGYVAPARSLTTRDAAKYGETLNAVVENNPACFEGEDLSVAYALRDRLYSGPYNPEAIRLAVMVELSEEEARVLSRAEACYPQLEQGLVSPPITPMPPTGGARITAPLPEGPDPFPLVPVAIGAGAVGLIALIVSVVK